MATTNTSEQWSEQVEPWTAVNQRSDASTSSNATTASPSPRRLCPVTETDMEFIVRECVFGNFEAVRQVLNDFPEIVNHGQLCVDALQVASQQGHVDIVKLLLDAGVTIDSKDEHEQTVLEYAIMGDQAEVLELLLNYGVSVDAVDDQGRTLLHSAANCNSPNCVNVLLRRGAKANMEDSDGFTPLHCALFKEYPQDLSPESVASIYANRQVIYQLIDVLEVNLAMLCKEGMTYMHHAALNGNIFATEMLIRRAGQVLDQQTVNGLSPLHFAAMNGHHNVCKILITKAYANINVRDCNDETPLHLAVREARASVIQTLVHMGADCNAVDENGDTVLHKALARWNEAVQVDEYEVKEGKKIVKFLTNLSEIGQSDRWHLAIACYLIRYGELDMNRENKNGRTPLDLVNDEGGSDAAVVKAVLRNMIELRKEKEEEKERLGIRPEVRFKNVKLLDSDIDNLIEATERCIVSDAQVVL